MTDHHSEGRAVHIGCAGAVSSFAASNLAPAGQRGPPMALFRRGSHQRPAKANA
jgi:hypothetical protein